ncbi:MAG: hypothetical protein HQ581_15690 [Planctomycetes bacterium]|nr:hypothetical protein [Planctomycetota bacterium]
MSEDPGRLPFTVPLREFVVFLAEVCKSGYRGDLQSDRGVCNPMFATKKLREAYERLTAWREAESDDRERLAPPDGVEPESWVSGLFEKIEEAWSLSESASATSPSSANEEPEGPDTARSCQQTKARLTELHCSLEKAASQLRENPEAIAFAKRCMFAVMKSWLFPTEKVQDMEEVVVDGALTAYAKSVLKTAEDSQELPEQLADSSKKEAYTEAAWEIIGELLDDENRDLCQRLMDACDSGHLQEQTANIAHLKEERIKAVASRSPEDDAAEPVRNPKALISELEAAVQLPPACEWEAKTGLPLPVDLEELEELLALTGMPLDVIFSGEWTPGEVGSMLMGALQRRREAETGTEGETAARPMVDDDWAFFPSGNGYEIAAFGETAPFPKLVGFDRIYKLLQRAGKDVPMVELIGGSQDERIERDGHSQQPAMTVEAKRACEEKLRELEEDIEQAKANSDYAEQERLESEKEELKNRVLADFGIQHRPRDLNNPAEKWRPRILDALKTARGKLIEAGMAELAAHFKNEITTDSKSATVTYSPQSPPPWVLSKKPPQ